MFEYDVAVIGAGSAGAAAAARLLDLTNESVILVDAGPDYGPRDAGLWPADLRSPDGLPSSHDWGYFEPISRGGRLSYPRGRVFGGSSSVNAAEAVWAPAADYDRWAQILGDEWWSYDTLRSEFGLVEDAQPRSPYRGVGGPVPSAQIPEHELTEWSRAFRGAAERAGFSDYSDPSEPTGKEGFARMYRNVVGGDRFNSSFAYIDPRRGNPRLTLQAGTTVDRLELDGDRVVGVHVIDSHGGSNMIRAGRVILSAGAIGTPAILMRSGIGPADELRVLDIEPTIHLPGVGARLQDQLAVMQLFELSAAGRTAWDADVAAGHSGWPQYPLRAQNQSAGGGLLDVLSGGMQVPGGQSLHFISSFQLSPHSEGAVRLTTADPLAPPAVSIGAFTDPDGHDLAALRAAAELGRDLANQAPLRGMISRELEPTGGLRGTELDSHLRANPVIFNHLVGTARMAPASDPLGVADSRGQVRGVANLVAADASIMPAIISANTNLTAMLIGARLAVQEGILL